MYYIKIDCYIMADETTGTHSPSEKKYYGSSIAGSGGIGPFHCDVAAERALSNLLRSGRVLAARIVKKT